LEHKYKHVFLKTKMAFEISFVFLNNHVRTMFNLENQNPGWVSDRINYQIITAAMTISAATPAMIRIVLVSDFNLPRHPWSFILASSLSGFNSTALRYQPTA
jgi:hypothetical protein